MDTKEKNDKKPNVLIYQAMLLYIYSQITERNYEAVMNEFNGLNDIDQEKYLREAERLCELESVELTLDTWGEIEKYLHLLDQHENMPSSEIIIISSN